MEGHTDPAHAMKQATKLRFAGGQNAQPGLSGWRWAVIGACTGMLTAFIFGAPARWWTRIVSHLTHEQLQLRAPTGTIWSGSSQLVLTSGPEGVNARSLPGRVQWQWGLDAKGLKLTLHADCCTPAPLVLHMGWRFGAWTVDMDAQTSRWPLALLTGLGAPWNTLQADGVVQWNSQPLRLSWAQGRMVWRGQTQLQILNMSSRLSNLRPMGNYELTLSGAQAGTSTPDLTLKTISGPLRMSGKGQWVGHRMRFTGEASADEGSEAALDNLLNIIGRRDGSRSRISLG